MGYYFAMSRWSFDLKNEYNFLLKNIHFQATENMVNTELPFLCPCSNSFAENFL